MAGDLLDAPVGELLESLAGENPSPGGGSAAAIVVAMAAGLVAKVARASHSYWDEAGGVIGQAESFRARVAPLAQADAEAYDEALSALRGREELAEAGCDLACLAALLVENGNPEVRADAAAAAILAESGARVAAQLVGTNLGATADDPRVRHVESLVEIAADASERALAAAR